MEYTTEVSVEIELDADDIISAFYGDMDELLREMDIAEIISYLINDEEVDALFNRIDNEAIIKYMLEESGGSAEMLDAIPNEITLDYVVHNTDQTAILREVNDDLILKYVTHSIPIAHVRRAFDPLAMDIVDKDEEKPAEEVLSSMDPYDIFRYLSKTCPQQAVHSLLHANDSERTTLTALNAISNESLLKCIAERLPHFALVPKGEEKSTLLSILKDRAADYPWNFTPEEKTWLFSSVEATDLINAIFARGLTLSLMEEFIKRSARLGTDQRLVATQEENNNE
jgi:hypothetical protein